MAGTGGVECKGIPAAVARDLLLQGLRTAPGDLTMQAVCLALFLLFSLNLALQGQPGEGPQRRPRFGGPIVLNPDDVQAFPEPPGGINAVRQDVPHGKLEMIEYDS